MPTPLPYSRLCVPALALAALLSAFPLHGAEDVYDVRSGVRVINESVADGAKPTVVVKTGPGALKFNSPNTFSGGLALREGSVINGAEWAFGTGPITLGEASGSASVILDIGNFSNYTTIPNPIAIQPGTGRVTIRQAGGFNNFLGGPVTGRRDLFVATDGGANLSFSELLNIGGELKNVSGGPGIIQMKGGVGPEVLALVQDGARSSINVSEKPVEVGPQGIRLVNNAGGKGLAVFSSTTGAGDVILLNNSPVENGVRFGGAGLMHEGDLINAGAGDGSVAVNAIITSRVRNVVQDSATSSLILGSDNHHIGDTVIRRGRLVVTTAAALPTRGKISLQGGVLELRATQERMLSLELTAASTVDLRQNARASFVVSRGAPWIGGLQITGEFVSGESIRFGADGRGLDSRQLALVRVEGHRDPRLDARGYLVATPVTR